MYVCTYSTKYRGTESHFQICYLYASSSRDALRILRPCRRRRHSPVSSSIKAVALHSNRHCFYRPTKSAATTFASHRFCLFKPVYNSSLKVAIRGFYMLRIASATRQLFFPFWFIFVFPEPKKNLLRDKQKNKREYDMLLGQRSNRFESPLILPWTSPKAIHRFYFIKT